MNTKTPSNMIAMLLILGGGVFGFLGGVHAIYTLLDLRNPLRLVPDDPSVAQAMARSAVRLTSGGTDMWRAWVGFNFTHSLGLLLFAGLAIWAGTRGNRVPAGIMPTLIVIGGVYLVLTLRYFYRSPGIGVAIGTGCFAAAWLLSLK